MPLGLSPSKRSSGTASHFSRYTVTDLGVLGEGTNSSAFDMNNVGWVAGSSNLTPAARNMPSFGMATALLKDLGTLGGPNSAADGPNLFGEAPIGSEISKTDPDGEDFCGFGTHLQCRGAIWRFGKLTALRSLPGGRNANAFGINNLGQLVGWAENGVRDSTCATATPFQVFRVEAVKWEPNGEIHELRPLTERATPSHSASGSTTTARPSAHRVPARPRDCHRQTSPACTPCSGKETAHPSTSAPSETRTTRSSMPRAASMIGEWWSGHRNTRRHHPHLPVDESNGHADIGTLPGAFATIAPCCHTINNRGEIVGFSIDGNGPTAFLWRDNDHGPQHPHSGELAPASTVCALHQ